MMYTADMEAESTLHSLRLAKYASVIVFVLVLKNKLKDARSTQHLIIFERIARTVMETCMLHTYPQPDSAGGARITNMMSATRLETEQLFWWVVGVDAASSQHVVHKLVLRYALVRIRLHFDEGRDGWTHLAINNGGK